MKPKVRKVPCGLEGRTYCWQVERGHSTIAHKDTWDQAFALAWYLAAPGYLRWSPNGSGVVLGPGDTYTVEVGSLTITDT